MGARGRGGCKVGAGLDGVQAAIVSCQRNAGPPAALAVALRGGRRWQSSTRILPGWFHGMGQGSGSGTLGGAKVAARESLLSLVALTVMTVSTCMALSWLGTDTPGVSEEVGTHTRCSRSTPEGVPCRRNVQLYHMPWKTSRRVSAPVEASVPDTLSSLRHDGAGGPGSRQWSILCLRAGLLRGEVHPARGRGRLRAIHATAKMSERPARPQTHHSQ